MGIEKTGDWEGFSRILENASSQFKSNVQNATNQAGRMLQAKIRERITSGQVQPPTSPEFTAWKEKHGYSETTLIMTSDLLNAINYEKKDWASGFVGVNRNAEGNDGKELINIAAVHEFGMASKPNFPKRPFIGPVAEAEGPKVAEFYQKAIEETFKK